MIEQYGFEAALTIKEVSEMMDIPQNTLRSWEEKLDEAFIVPRDPQGNRFYTQKHLDTIRFINGLRESEPGFSFPQIKAVLLRMQENEQNLQQSSGINMEEEGGGQSITALAQFSPASLSATNQMQRLTLQMEEKMALFFDQMDQMLQRHSQMTKDYISDEIEGLKAAQNNHNEKVLESLESKLQEKFLEDNKTITESVALIKNDIENYKTEQQAHLENLSDAVTKGIDSKLDSSMEQWAIISKEDLQALKNKKKKGFLGIFSKGE